MVAFRYHDLCWLLLLRPMLSNMYLKMSTSGKALTYNVIIEFMLSSATLFPERARNELNHDEGHFVASFKE